MREDGPINIIASGYPTDRVGNHFADSLGVTDLDSLVQPSSEKAKSTSKAGVSDCFYLGRYHRLHPFYLSGSKIESQSWSRGWNGVGYSTRLCRLKSGSTV
jgi:hypothetical protein